MIVVGTYPYTITAEALGGNLTAFNNEVEIKRVCRSDTITAFDDVKAAFKEFVPESKDITYNFPESSDKYVESALDGCTHKFTYVMANGDPNPAELTLDESTGIFSLAITRTLKKKYDVNVIIETSGSDVEEKLTVENIQVETLCGPQSTVITNPPLPYQNKTEKITRLFSNSGAFTVSNDACPIVKTEMIEGLEYYDFESTPVPNFKLTLNKASAGVIGKYDYKLLATAEGGATNANEATGQMEVFEQICDVVLPTDPAKQYTYNLPVETATETMYSDHQVYAHNA